MARQTASSEVIELDALENDGIKVTPIASPGTGKGEHLRFNEQTNYLPPRRVIEVRK
jgi:hypothetical protein